MRQGGVTDLRRPEGSGGPEGAGAHSADPVGDGGQVDLLPHQRVGVALVDVVGVDLGAAAVFGAFPGQRHGGAVAAQHGDSVRSAGRG